MLDLILNFFVFILILIGLLGILVVLMQKTSTQAGMGAALTGGGAADQAFGAESATVLTKATQTITILFFVLAFLLYLGFQARHASELKAQEDSGLLPVVPPVEMTTGEAEIPVGAETEVTVEADNASAMTSEGATGTESPGDTEPQP